MTDRDLAEQLFIRNWAPHVNEKVLADRCLDAVREFRKHAERRGVAPATWQVTWAPDTSFNWSPVELRRYESRVYDIPPDVDLTDPDRNR